MRTLLLQGEFLFPAMLCAFVTVSWENVNLFRVAYREATRKHALLCCSRIKVGVALVRVTGQSPLLTTLWYAHHKLKGNGFAYHFCIFSWLSTGPFYCWACCLPGWGHVYLFFRWADSAGGFPAFWLRLPIRMACEWMCSFHSVIFLDLMMLNVWRDSAFSGSTTGDTAFRVDRPTTG